MAFSNIVYGFHLPVHNDSMRDVHTLQITPVMFRIIKQLQTVTCPAVFNLNQPKTEIAKRKSLSKDAKLTSC